MFERESDAILVTGNINTVTGPSMLGVGCKAEDLAV
jgi:hypothetical protein